MGKNYNWIFFYRELGNLIFFWFVGIIYFLLFRITFISIFHKQIEDDSTLFDIIKALATGFKFDCIAVSYFIIPPFLFLLLFFWSNSEYWIKTIRKIAQILFTIFATLICIVTINYFDEYNDQFNNFLFLSLYDDQKAVFQSIIKDFNPVLNVCLFILSIIGLLWIFSKFEQKRLISSFLQKINFKYHKPVLIFTSIVLVFFSLRGSVSSISAKRKYSCVTKDSFLNKTIINPFRSLKYALDDFKEVNDFGKENPFVQEKDLFAALENSSVSEALLKKTKGPMISKPKQIFLVIMESYDSWPLLDKYKDFNVANHLKNIAQKGIHFENFLPASNSTFDAYSSIVSNIPYCGVNISVIGAHGETYISSMFTHFKSLGYTTNMFYGGFSSWQNLEKFSMNQGLDNLYCGFDAGGKIKAGDWGISDKELFKFVLSKINPEEYTLNVILTSSYHTPFTVDLKSENFIYNSQKDLPKNVSKYFDNSMTIKELGHLWYGDQAIGEFMKTAEKKYGEALFAFTGDHFGRRFINSKPTLYENSTVPFILYGKNLPAQKLNHPGSHIDIMPTLIEMIAPENFEYYSFGESLFNNQKKYAYSVDRLITNKHLYHFKPNGNIETFDLITNKKVHLTPNQTINIHKELLALSWHYTIKGNNFATK